MAKILVTEDEPDIQALIYLVLTREGHVVISAGDGEMAYEVAKVQQPDAVLMDVRMPGISGYEACRLIKADPITQHIPVIFVSVRSARIEKSMSAEVGGAGYVGKPFDPRELIDRLNEVLATAQPAPKPPD